MSVIINVLMFMLLAALEGFYIAAARRLGIVSAVTERSSHSEPTVAGGGVVYLFGLMGFAVVSGFSYPVFTLAALILALVSFTDDVHPLGVGVRLAVQLLCIGAMGAGLHAYGGYPWWAGAAGVVCAAGLVNAWNFMDGINGITALYTTITLGTLYVINTYGGYGFVSEEFLTTGLMASVIFGWCNFRRRALCFAGDVGAVTAAVTVLYALARLMLASGSLIWLGLVMVYGVDAVLTLVHRLARGENIFRAHRMHAYQLLANEGRMNQLAVSGIYGAIQIGINIGLMMWSGNPWWYLGAAAAALCAAYVCVVRRFYRGKF